MREWGFGRNRANLMGRLPVVRAGDTLKVAGDLMSEKLTQEESVIRKKLVLRPPARREDLLRFTEDDPEGAVEFIELLREFREDMRSRPKPA